MISRIVWLEEAELGFARIWQAVDPATREILTRQVYSLRDALREDPENVGESRDGNRRIASFRPLGVSFEVDWDRSTVWIQSVHYAAGTAEGEP